MTEKYSFDLKASHYNVMKPILQTHSDNCKIYLSTLRNTKEQLEHSTDEIINKITSTNESLKNLIKEKQNYFEKLKNYVMTIDFTKAETNISRSELFQYFADSGNINIFLNLSEYLKTQNSSLELMKTSVFFKELLNKSHEFFDKSENKVLLSSIYDNNKIITKVQPDIEKEDKITDYQKRVNLGSNCRIFNIDPEATMTTKKCLRNKLFLSSLDSGSNENLTQISSKKRKRTRRKKIIHEDYDSLVKEFYRYYQANKPAATSFFLKKRSILVNYYGSDGNRTTKSFIFKDCDNMEDFKKIIDEITRFVESHQITKYY